jgi:hypothetical protein
VFVVALQKRVIATQQRALPSKVVDGESNAAQNNQKSSPMSIELGARPFAQLRKPRESIWFKTLMHFSFYLMIAALVILGVEVAYALYQLAGLFL